MTTQTPGLTSPVQGVGATADAARSGGAVAPEPVPVSALSGAGHSREVPFCPHCGYNLRAEKPVTDGRYRYDPSVGFYVDGERIKARPAVHMLLGTLLLAQGRILTDTLIADRIGYDGENPKQNVSVLLCHARQAIAATGAMFPVETIYKSGFRWNVHAPAPRWGKRAHKPTSALAAA